MLQPRKLNARKLAQYELRATTLECNAVQCEVKLVLTSFHKRYFTCIKAFHTQSVNNKVYDWSWLLLGSPTVLLGYISLFDALSGTDNQSLVINCEH